MTPLWKRTPRPLCRAGRVALVWESDPAGGTHLVCDGTVCGVSGGECRQLRRSTFLHGVHLPHIWTCPHVAVWVLIVRTTQRCVSLS